jgi:hypothetical protein
LASAGWRQVRIEGVRRVVVIHSRSITRPRRFCKLGGACQITWCTQSETNALIADLQSVIQNDALQIPDSCNRTHKSPVSYGRCCAPAPTNCPGGERGMTGGFCEAPRQGCTYLPLPSSPPMRSSTPAISFFSSSLYRSRHSRLSLSVTKCRVKPCGE